MSKYTNFIENSLSNDSFWQVNKAIVHGTGSMTAAILLADLISKRKYFQAQGTIQSDGSFFNTTDNIETDLGIGKTARLKAQKILVKCGLISVVQKGLPSKNYYFIHDDAIASMLKTRPPSGLKSSRLEGTKHDDLRALNLPANNNKPNNNKSNKNKKNNNKPLTSIVSSYENGGTNNQGATSNSKQAPSGKTPGGSEKTTQVSGVNLKALLAKIEASAMPIDIKGSFRELLKCASSDHATPRQVEICKGMFLDQYQANCGKGYFPLCSEKKALLRKIGDEIYDRESGQEPPDDDETDDAIDSKGNLIEFTEEAVTDDDSDEPEDSSAYA